MKLTTFKRLYFGVSSSSCSPVKGYPVSWISVDQTKEKQKLEEYWMSNTSKNPTRCSVEESRSEILPSHVLPK